MSTSVPAANVLRTRGPQFIRLFQGALRLVALYSADHSQAQVQIERACTPLEAILKECRSLSISFQFDRVVLNSLSLPDPTLSPLAAELSKRRVGALIFYEGITEPGLGQMLTVLAARPEDIEEAGGLVKFLQAHPLERARIVPIQMAGVDGTLAAASAAELAVAAADGGVALVTSSEMAAAMSRIPRWMLLVMQESTGTGTGPGAAGPGSGPAGPVISPHELPSLAACITPDLTPQQVIGLPQLQEMLARVAQRVNSGTLAEVLRAVVGEVGDIGAALLEPVLVRSLGASIEAGYLPQAERILRAASELETDPQDLLERVPPEKAPDEAREHLRKYLAWLRRPRNERLAELGPESDSHEFRWLTLEVEHQYKRGQAAESMELLLALLRAGGPAEEVERAEVLDRCQHLLAQFCATGYPAAAESFVEALSHRLQTEESPVAFKPVAESLVVLTQGAAERRNYALAAAGAGAIAELAEEFSPRGDLARETKSRLLKPGTVAYLVKTHLSHKDDPEIGRALLPLLKRIGDQVARELLVMLEKEPVAAKRLKILHVVKQLGKSAADALGEKISDPQWYVVRNAVLALAELADPSLLSRIEPALSHPDERVQQAALAAAQKTRSPLRGLPLARSLPNLKPALLEQVLDDLLVLKESQAVPYLEKFLLQPAGDARLDVLQKALAALGAIRTEDAAYALLHCANEPSVAAPVRQAAVRALGRLELPTARQLLAEFVRTTPDAALAQEARTLLGA